MLILGIVLGAGVLLVLLVVVCGGAFFFVPIGGPPEPQPTPEKVRAADEGPAKGWNQGVKEKNGPPAGPDK